MKLRSKYYPFYFVLGALTLYLIFFIIPSISGIAYSFTDWSSYSDEVNFIGLTNFKEIFAPGAQYMKYVWNTVFFTTTATLLCAVATAILLYAVKTDRQD